MRETQTKEEETNQGEVMELDGFPEREEEFNSVQEINEEMTKARDYWNPPEKPDYRSSKDGELAYYEGVIRSIDTSNVRQKDYKMVRLGLDVQEDELNWVRVKDTGERNLENPFVRFCKMYDVNPESVQELYSTRIYVDGKYDSPIVPPSQPVIKQLWALQHIQHKHDFYKYEKKTHFKGLVPNLRHLMLYGSITIVSLLLANTLVSLVAIPVFLFAVSMFSWGVYAKFKYDVGPYLGELLKYYWKVYSHKRA